MSGFNLMPIPLQGDGFMIYEIQTHALIVKPKGAALFSERATIVGLTDEGAGPYVCLEQPGNRGTTIGFECEEWPFIREAIDRLMLLCHTEKPKVMYQHPVYDGFTWDGKGDKPEWMRDWIAAGNDPMDCFVPDSRRSL